MRTFADFLKYYGGKFKRKPLAPLVLPAVYDDVLSYEEWLSKVVYMVNALGAYIEDQLEDVDNVVIEDITDKLTPILDDIEKIKSALAVLRETHDADINEIKENLDAFYNGLFDLIEKRYKDAIDYCDAKIAEIDAMLLKIRADLEKLIANAEKRAKIYTDTREYAITIAYKSAIRKLSNRIDNLQKEYPFVYSPATGYYKSVQEAIVETWDSLRVLGLTADRYDDMEFTVEDYDDLDLTAFEYDVYANWILGDTLHQMFNPFTGKNTSIRVVVNDIVKYLKFNAKTASQYDALGFTAEEFDNSDYNAYKQDSSQYYKSTAPDYKNKKYYNYVLAFFGVGDGGATTTTVLNGESDGIRVVCADMIYDVEEMPSDVGGYITVPVGDDTPRELTITKTATGYSVDFGAESVYNLVTHIYQRYKCEDVTKM